MRIEIFKKFLLLLCTCTIPLVNSCNKKDSGPVDMTPIFLAVHKQASIEAKNYVGKFFQFDSTKPFYIYSGYNFKGTVNSPLESLSLTDSSHNDDNLFGNKVYLEQSTKFHTIDSFPNWDNIYQRMKPFDEKLRKNLNKTTIWESENSGEYEYYLVKILKPELDKKNNIFFTTLHITDNVFQNFGFFYSVKFNIVDNKIKVVSIRQYEISISLPPPEPNEKHEDGTPPPRRSWSTIGG